MAAVLSQNATEIDMLFIALVQEPHLFKPDLPELLFALLRNTGV